MLEFEYCGVRYRVKDGWLHECSEEGHKGASARGGGRGKDAGRREGSR